MRLKISKDVVPYKLSRELRAAGIEILYDVKLLPKSGLYIPLVDEALKGELITIIEQVIEAHDGINDIEALKADAETRIKNIPGWATWTPTQAQEWYNNEVEPLNIPPALKSFIRASIIMHLATRDNLWPELKNE